MKKRLSKYWALYSYLALAIMNLLIALFNSRFNFISWVGVGYCLGCMVQTYLSDKLRNTAIAWRDRRATMFLNRIIYQDGIINEQREKIRVMMEREFKSKFNKEE